MNKITHVSVKMDAGARGGWNLLLQKGFFKVGPGGRTVREFLMAVLDFESDFIDKSVRTIFLNYSPVDDIDETIVHDGDKLSLGSAMPGLVGIVMGRDNPFKSFREDITCTDTTNNDDGMKAVRVFFKIFSTLAVDTGADILACGIESTAGDVRTVINNYKDHLIDVAGLDGIDDEELIGVSIQFKE